MKITNLFLLHIPDFANHVMLKTM